MKSQKSSLDDQVKRTKLAVEKAIKPQVSVPLLFLKFQ